MKERKTWWITRPTRDLHDIEDALKCFSNIANGKKWFGQRELHQRFEMENPAKTSNMGRYGSGGSGGRTWAAWLRMWGLWYDDNCVSLSQAGNLIVTTKNPEDISKQIKHLIMTFQITNAYLKKQGTISEFKIFPFQFIIELLLHKDINYLTVDEIGLFVIDVKKYSEFNHVVKKIIDWRKKYTEKLKHKLIVGHMKKYNNPRKDSPENPHDYWQSIQDIARTFASNISYISEIEYNRGKLSICEKNVKYVQELLCKHKDAHFIPVTDNESIFIRKFGMRYDRRKSSDKDTKPQSRAIKQDRRIKKAIEELKKTDTFKEHTLVKDLKKITNYSERIIENHILNHPENITDDEFARYYMECACDGTKHREFEELTRTIFKNMKFPTEKKKAPKTGEESPSEIDGLILNPNTGLSGLLECKSGKKYALNKGDAEKMKHVYIKCFKERTINGKKYRLDFFTYVVGKKITSQSNFQGIIKNTKIRGSVIYANDLLKLYCMYLQKKTSSIKIWGLFKLGKIITWGDIIDICDTSKN